MMHVAKYFAGILLGATAAQAQDAAPPSQGPGRSAGADLFYSSDADETVVARYGADFDIRYAGADDYLGIRVERASFDPLGRGWVHHERIYARAAKPIGSWKAQARVGTDGDTILGSASIHNEARFRQEYFVEREIVETPIGLRDGIYYTFGGASVDMPIDDRNVVTMMAGLQEFTGDNLRTHLRASYIHVVEPKWGLSAQLRGRYFRNSDPREFDYYSPRWFGQILPVLQVRRFEGGWRYQAAAGLGAQRDSETGWKDSRFLNLQVASPARKNYQFTADVTYTNTPTELGSYGYFQTMVGVRKSF